MANHGIYVSEAKSSSSSPVSVATGIPVDVGLSPIQNAENPAPVGLPIVIRNFAEFVERFGYSDDWATYPLCEFAYSHFQIFGMQPAIFINLLDPATHKSAVAAADKDVTAKKVELTETAIDDSGLVVKAAGGNGTAYVKDTDYSVYYNEDRKLVVELLPDSTHYSETSLNIAYNAVTPASINASAVATGIDKIDLCMSKADIIPDLIVATGFSHNASVAAVMAAKAGAVNGMFKAKALIDIDASTVTTIAGAVTAKTTNNFTSPDEIVCWPMVKFGTRKFHLSSLLAGVIAATDVEYGASYVSPSNKLLGGGDALILADGTEVNMSISNANTLNANGIVTALNFMGDLRAWGNYTAAYPDASEVKDTVIPVRRMFDWVNNSLIQTFWSRLDSPMNRRFIDSILDSANIWMNGLTGTGYILGGRVEMLDSENPTENLLNNIVKLHIYMTPTAPAQEIDFVLEYDASYLEEAFT